MSKGANVQLRRLTSLSLAVLVATAIMSAPGAAFAAPLSQAPAPENAGATKPSADSGPESHHDVSGPLASLRPAAPVSRGTHTDQPLPTPPASTTSDPALQTSPSTSSAPTATNNILGVGNGFSGPNGTFTVNSAPPDTTGAVGPNHYVQVVNTDLAIYNKSGAVVYGPVPTNTLWSGFGGTCQSTNDGDGIVKYDVTADRWVITQFANVASRTGPYLQCVAVSTTPDPTGSYNRYSFSYTSFPDYGKMGVWPDAYYMTFNMFGARTGAFQGAQSCAYDRSRMLVGQSATQQCFMTSPAYGGVLPADLDGATPPPAGEPNTQIALGTTSTSLATWRFHVDWTTPSNSTFTQGAGLAVAAYTQACNGGTCIPQPGTTNQLDSLADRLMYRFVYRNFGDHESLVVNDSVNVGSTQGVRWYELRLTGGPSAPTPTVYQQGTYSPDGTSRWMGSLAMDRAGDIALGYSTSSSSVKPSIAYTGRLAGDPLNSMTQGEATLMAGSGSQTGTLTRWGDYSTMSVDPTDGCTFWYTSEYLPADGTFNWSTRIGSFTFPSCVPIQATPSSGTVGPGASTGPSAIALGTNGWGTGTVSLGATGLPSGATATFSPTSVSPGGSSSLTIGTLSSTPLGTFPISIIGTQGGTTNTATYSLTVAAPPGPNVIANGGFETGTLSSWTTAGITATSSTAHSGTYSAKVGSSSASTDSTVSQTFTVPPGGGTLSFWYQVHCPDTLSHDWATATLKDNVSNLTTTLLPHTCSNGGAWVQVNSDLEPNANDSVTLTLANHDDNNTTNPTYTLYDDLYLGGPDFTISASPTSLTIPQGEPGIATITTTVIGQTGQISLDALGLPSGAAGRFTPSTVTAGGTSTLTVSVGSAVAPGTYTLSVLGTETAAPSHATSVAVTVELANPAAFGTDGLTDRSLYRPSTGQWLIQDLSPEITQYGTSGDIPVPGDYDGIGHAQIAVYRPSTGQWFVRNSSIAEITQYGTSGDIPVPGDYDGIGHTQIAIYRPSTGQWFVRNSSIAEITQYGTSGDTVLPLPYATRQAFGL